MRYRIPLVAALIFAVMATVTLSAESVIVIDPESTSQEVRDVGRAAGRISEGAKQEGLRIADEARDFANDVADSFSEGFDEGRQR